METLPCDAINQSAVAHFQGEEPLMLRKNQEFVSGKMGIGAWTSEEDDLCCNFSGVMKCSVS